MIKRLELVHLALRLLWRERSASEVHSLVLALFLAVATSSAIGLFSQRLHASMTQQASRFLGADLILIGSQEPSAELLAGAPAAQAQAVELPSMVGFGDALQLASLKAVSPDYPLRGVLKSQAQRSSTERTGGLPKPGELWAEQRLLDALNAKPGDWLELGAARFKLSAILTSEPDRGGDWYSLSPRVLINLSDLPATELVQPGSRLTLKNYWKGSPQQIEQLKRQLQPKLSAAQRLQDAQHANPQLEHSLGLAQNYLNLAALAALLLAAVALALAAQRFAAQRLDSSALLRCLGLPSTQLFQLYIVQLSVLTLLATGLGLALGWLVHWGLIVLLADLLPKHLPPADARPALSALFSALLCVLGFALPTLLELAKVPPLRVLRRDLQGAPLRRLSHYALTLSALGLLLWSLRLDGRLLLALVAGAALMGLVLATLLWLCLKPLKRLLDRAPLAWRLGLGQLLRNPLLALTQTLAFALILFALGMVALLRGELVEQWQQQLPADTPNQFALNIQPDQRAAFNQALKQAGLGSAQLYPITPGRLLAINDQPVKQRTQLGAEAERALQRDLGLSFSRQLPPSNQLVQGQWWGAHHQGQVSVEANLAHSLGLKLGDRLTVLVAGQERSAEVSSLRRLRWDSFQPNFYLLFSPDVLEGLPHSYLTSFALPAERPQLLRQLNQAFPAVTFLAIDDLLKQVRSLLTQLSQAIECLLLLVLAAALCVLWAGLLTSLDERLQHGAILRALGAPTRLLRFSRLTEFAVQGAASGFLALLACELCSALLAHFVLNSDWQAHPSLLILPLGGSLLVTAIGLWSTLPVRRISPMTLLRSL